MTTPSQPRTGHPSKISEKSVGILGGGQLGCMLTDAAIALGLEPKVFAEPGSPAAALFPERAVLGSLRDEAAVARFFQGLPVVAFENEFLDCDLLVRAARGLPLRFSPGLAAVRELQDKLRQKQRFVELGLPTADFLPILPDQNSSEAVKNAYEHFAGQVVFKWSRMGYDGKGVCLAQDTPEGREAAVEFCDVSLLRGVPVYAERKISFKQELAVIGCRSVTGDFAAYPLVVSEQTHGICKRVLGPATALGVPAELEAQAIEAARKLAGSVHLEGSFAIELFVTPEGGLSVNEVAPRVHNSGHYTQDACGASQFENHWRAVLGMALGDTRATPAFGMLNLLGPEGVAISLPQSRTSLPFDAPAAPLQLHWYAKGQVRPWRKVGHLNAALADPSLIQAMKEDFERYQTDWTARLREIQNQAQTRTPQW